MLAPTLAMAALAVFLLFLGHQKGGGEDLAGLKIAFHMVWTILPLLLFAFIVAGMIQTLIPPQVVSKWVGEESGFRGIFLASIAGGLTPGGPYVSLPIATGLARAGASIGTMVAFLTGWSLWAVARIPMEIGILGWKLTLARVASTLIFPPIAGLLANALFGR